MPDFAQYALLHTVGIMLIAALVIGFTGWRLTGYADRLADRTGLGEAVTGALFLGAATSLPGIVTSVSAAAGGYAELAVSNAIGGIAAQTVFLVVADMAYTKANLEHAAASIPNMMHGALLIILLTMILVTAAAPPVSIWGISPATPAMLAAYIYGMRMVSKARLRPMWHPRLTMETREDIPDKKAKKEKLLPLWISFLASAAIVGIVGWVVARSGIAIAEQTGLSETAVGSLMTAVVTSLPELVTSIAAVRKGAHTLAVSGIIGGNAFDTLFAAVSDIAYRDGSIYHAITSHQIFFVSLTILLTAILLLGMLRREKHGIANIGFEGFLVLAFYLAAAAFLLFAEAPS